MALCKVESTAKTAPETELVATASLSNIEEIFNSKFQVLLYSIYDILLRSTPGYVVRNILNSLLVVCNSKVATVSSRECAITIIGYVMEKRSMDIGSMISDVVMTMTRVIKSTENPTRLAAVQATTRLLSGAGARVADCHVELAKLCAKYNTDRSVEIRQKIALMIGEIGSNSAGYTTISFDILHGAAVKGLEDEVGAVQEAYAQTLAVLYMEQIHAHTEEQEQAKIGLARGGSAPVSESPKGKASSRGSLSKLKDIALKDIMTTSTTKKTDENDYKTVVKSVLRTMAKSSALVRAGYVSVLRHLIQLLLPSLQLDKDTLSWMSTHVILVLRDSTISTLPYEEIVNFRSRLAHLIRTSITCFLSEPNQITFASALTSFLTSTEARSEHELQLALGELGHVVTSLGEASISVCEEIKAAANVQLRNSSFGVRAAAAYVFAALASVIPASAAGFLKDALTGAAVQVKQLLAFEDADYNATAASDNAGEGEPSGGSSPGPARKNPRDAERLQRMFYFHGHSLVISIFLKNERSLPTGLPSELVMNAFDFGLEMLTLDIQSAPPTLRHVVCSVIRAGSLIVSSCLNMGYKVAKSRIGVLLDCCNTLLLPTSSPPPASSSAAAGQDLLYELMSAEAALVCISTLLWFCPDSLVYDANCLITIVDGLENTFRAIKTKYQSKFRGHFRFRTLHVILLECFAWLPPGSFPNTCPQLFVEALRVFRDSISAGYECTCLCEFVPPDHNVLYTSGVSKPPSLGFADPPMSENMMMLKLEQYSVALQKKESEAFLACFSKEVHMPEFRRTPLHATDWMEPSPPVAFIDSRTVDASIALVAATFGHQTNDYQEKAVQLCSQAMAQHMKTAGGSSAALGIFSSEEDRRKKDRKCYVSLKNVTAVLSAIIRSFPFHNGMSLELDLQWVQVVAERLFEMLSYSNVEIRSASASALGVFCSKIFGAQLMDTMGMKITQAIRNSVDRKGDNMADLSGHVLALSSLWVHAASQPAVQDNILTIVLDTLKRVECSLMFRAYGLFSLSCILKYRSINRSSCDIADTNSLIDRVLQILEVHLVCAGTLTDQTAQYEHPLLLVCLQRLVNTTLPIILEVDPQSEHIQSLVKMWDVIRKSSSLSAVQHECMEFILASSVVPMKTLDPVVVAEFIKQSLQHPEHTNTDHLGKAVACVRILVVQNVDVVCSAGLDIDLFTLLDWCIATSATSCTSPYWGVELRSGMENVVLGNTRVLQQEIEGVLDSLVAVDVQRNADQRAAHWVLLSRVIALGLRSGSGAPVHDEPDNEDHRDEKTTGELEESTSMTYVQFSSWCRENALNKGKDVLSTRFKLKCVALHCATTALIGESDRLSVAHSDLLLGRKLTQQHLDSLCTAKPTDESLSQLPCYLSLFMHDLVSLGCACASFSIEDHRLVSLQSSSLEFIQAVVNLFWNSIDPDDNADSSTAMITVPHHQKILQQYMAQIISAIRPSLSAEWAPALLWTAGGLVFNFILGGLLTDKVVVRRLAKMLLGVLEKKNAVFDVRSAVSLDVAGEVSTIQHIITSTNMARLFLLTTTYGEQVGSVGKEVRDTLAGMLESHLPKMTEVWYAIGVDGARILQGHGAWTTEQATTDCRRGGMSYAPTVDALKLQRHFEYALPFVVAAASFSDHLPEYRLSHLYSLSASMLGHLATYSTHYSVSACSGTEGSLIKNMKGSLGPLVLAGLCSLAHKLPQATRDQADDKEVPTNAWCQLVTFLADDLASETVSETHIEETCTRCVLISQLMATLATRILNDSSTEATSDSQDGKNRRDDFIHLACRMWVCNLIMARMCLGGIFSDIHDQDGDVGSHAYVYPFIQIDSRKSTDISKWWLNDSRGISVITSVISSIEQVSRFVGNNDMTVYMCNFLVAVVPYCALHIADDSARYGVLNVVTTSLVKASEYCDVSAVLLKELWVWQELTNATSSISLAGVDEVKCDPEENPKPESITECGRAIFSAWIQVCVENIHKNSSEYEINVAPLVATLMCKDTSMHYISGIVAAGMRMVQHYQSAQSPLVGTCVALLSSTLIPPLLRFSAATATAPTETNVHILLLQLVFVIFNLLSSDEQRSAYVRLILPSLCLLIEKRGANDNLSLVCGKGVTHIARTHPQLFRTEIAVLPPSQITLLQTIMRTVLEAMQGGVSSGTAQADGTAPSTSAGAPSSTGGLKMKIDMSKYRGS